MPVPVSAMLPDNGCGCSLYTPSHPLPYVWASTLRFLSDEEHVFSYEDYSMYYIIDLCATKYIETHHHNDLIYLIHLNKTRCYAMPNTARNLRDVLYYLSVDAA